MLTDKWIVTKKYRILSIQPRVHKKFNEKGEQNNHRMQRERGTWVVEGTGKGRAGSGMGEGGRRQKARRMNRNIPFLRMWGGGTL